MTVEMTNRTVSNAKYVESIVESLREVQRTMKYFPKHWNWTNNTFICGLAFDGIQKAQLANVIYATTAEMQFYKVKVLFNAYSDITTIISIFSSFMVDTPRALANPYNASTKKNTKPMKHQSDPSDNFVNAIPLHKMKIVADKLNKSAKLLYAIIKYENDIYGKYYVNASGLVNPRAINKGNNNITDITAQVMTTNSFTQNIPQQSREGFDWQPQPVIE